MTAPWSKVILSAAVPGAVALVGTLLVTVLAHGKLSRFLIKEPLPVVLVNPPGPEWGRLPEDPWGVDQESDDKESDGKRQQHPASPRYIRQDQIWDARERKYVEYIPRPPREEPDEDKLIYWFKVYSRQRTARKDERPTVGVEVLSQTLINFLRSVLGGSSTFSHRPMVDLHQLFSRQDTFKEWLEKLDPSAVQTLDLEAKEQMAADLGVPNNQTDGVAEEILQNHLARVRKQLNELLVCLQKEFEPIEHEITMYLAHGHIRFELLGYLFKPGVKLLYIDEYGDKAAFRVTVSGYWEDLFDNDTDGNMMDMHRRQNTFRLEGERYAWNGIQYGATTHMMSVQNWVGTCSLASLPWSILTPEDEQELAERGRIYCQYSGIFHVFNNGPLGGKGRAVVDHRLHMEESYNSDKTSDAVIAEENLCLLPATVQGFMLHKKAWVTMHVLALAPIVFDHLAWDHLVLDPDTKVAKESFELSEFMLRSQTPVCDVITGKGGGLVAVLHGKPGTGKTLTAEAVAEHLEQPLYVVGSEELPADASVMEQSLRTILDLSTRWNAVLLIDEADVILEQRSLHELQRNAVVSAALRLLEYHTGVLFLTTNRIKAFDEAFLSRFSIGIRYPDLDRTSRLKIWRSFLHMAEVDIVQDRIELVVADGKARIHIDDLERLAEKEFNGRSIKNLVHTSQALALARKQPLALEHIEIVARTSERFLRDFEDIQTKVRE